MTIARLQDARHWNRSMKFMSQSRLSRLKLTESARRIRSLYESRHWFFIVGLSDRQSVKLLMRPTREHKKVWERHFPPEKSLGTAFPTTPIQINLRLVINFPNTEGTTVVRALITYPRWQHLYLPNRATDVTALTLQPRTRNHYLQAYIMQLQWLIN